MKENCGKYFEQGRKCPLAGLCVDQQQRLPCPPMRGCSKCGARFNPLDETWRSTAESWEHRCKRRGRR